MTFREIHYLRLAPSSIEYRELLQSLLGAGRILAFIARSGRHQWFSFVGSQRCLLAIVVPPARAQRLPPSGKSGGPQTLRLTRRCPLKSHGAR